jgi:thioredoxin reductase
LWGTHLATFAVMRDVIIVGAGPAGLSAALVLGRCRRRVTLYDDGNPRNKCSRGVNGYLGCDGVAPEELRRIGATELAPYDVIMRKQRVVRAAPAEVGFEVEDAMGNLERSRKLLLATGVSDRLPEIPGVAELYGRAIYPCVYCDGWELRDQPLAAFGYGPKAAEFALGLLTWSSDVILFTHGGELASPEDLERLSRYRVALREERVVAFEPRPTGCSVVLETGEKIPRAGVFLHYGQTAQSLLAESFGCTVEAAGTVETFEKQRTRMPGLYLAGDASHDVKFAIVAAAHGARAAHDINQALRQEDTA